MKRLLLVIAIAAASAGDLHAGSPVWKVRRGPSVTYIGGTIHLLRESDFPPPAAFDAAFEDADLVVFETDIGALEGPEIQLRILSEALYQNGESLEDILSPRAYDSLRVYCEGIGLPVEALHPFKPWMVMLNLSALELWGEGFEQQYGIDLFYHRRAEQSGKPIAFLETVDEQLEFLLALGEGRESELILRTISDLRAVRENMEELIRCWRAGDEGELYDLLVAEMASAYPEIYAVLLKSRNDRWLEEIERFLATPERELVLVGAAHLVGEDGLLNRLAERGYDVEKMK